MTFIIVPMLGSASWTKLETNYYIINVVSVKTKYPKPFLILLLVALVVLVVLLNINYVNNMTDGAEKYSGDKLVAAQRALDRFDNLDDGIGTYPNFAKQRIKDIALTPGVKCNGSIREDAYTYKLETISWFGIKVDEYISATCEP
jgi:hypothetical protein